MKVQRTDEDPIYVDHYGLTALHDIMHSKHTINDYTKRHELNIYSKYL